MRNALWIGLLSWSGLVAQPQISTIAGGLLPPDVTNATSVSVSPWGVALDGAGNVYVSVFPYHAVYRMDTAGKLTLIAGSGLAGYKGDGGVATAAQLNTPKGLALDSTGNLYIADSFNGRIRKVSGGTISTVVDGLQEPTDVAVDATGNLYIVQRGVSGVTKVAGGTRTMLYTGTAFGVAVDGAGDVFFLDAYSRLWKVSGGITTQVAEVPSGDGSIGSLTVGASGIVYVAAYNQIFRVAGGTVTAVAGTGVIGYGGDGGPALAAMLSYPLGVAVDGAGNIYIADIGNSRLRKVTSGTIRTVAGDGSYRFGGDGGPATSALFNNPRGVATDSAGNVFVADTLNHRIRKISGGTVTTVAGNGVEGFSGDGGPATAAQLSYPTGVAVDGAGNLYIADASNHVIRKVTAGIITRFAGSADYYGYDGDGGPATDALLYYPMGVAVDGAGTVYIVDTNNGLIRKVAGGTITTVVDNVWRATGIAVDGSGNLYIADMFRYRVLKAAGGVITTVAGTGSPGFGGDGGPATAALLKSARNLAVDRAGNLFIVDSGQLGLFPWEEATWPNQSNNRIRKVTGGTITTLAGDGTYGFGGDGGPATAAQLNVPEGVAVDSAGNVYIADTANNRIRMVTGQASPSPVDVTIISNPPGRSVVVDGVAVVTPQTRQWVPQTAHTLDAVTPQTNGSARYRFKSWSQGGQKTQTVTAPSSAATYTANFTTDYSLTGTVVGSGSLSYQPSRPADGFYESGTSVQVTATPSAGWQFTGFSGSFSGTTSTQTISVTAPVNFVATFRAATTCAYQVSPGGQSFPADSGGGSFDVSAAAGCNWSVQGMPAWVTIMSGASGSGNGTVSYSIAANPSSTGREVTLRIEGQPYVITQVGSAVSAASGLRFVPLSPCRIVETRPDYNFEGRTGAFGPPFLHAGETRTLTVPASNVCPVPQNAKAYVLNVTLVPKGGVDFLTVWPGGDSRPNFWTVRSPDGLIVANAALVKPGVGGTIQVYASHNTDMVIDISGYFTDHDIHTTNLVYYPLTPCRVIDTRLVYRQLVGPFGPPSMAAKETRRFKFPDTPYCRVPAGAAAYSVTLTAVPQGALAFMTAWPSGQVQPNVSSINSPAGRVLANSVILPANTDGSVDVYAFNATDFLVDVNGYFAPDDGNGLYYYPVTQCRVSDSTTALSAPFGGPIYDAKSTHTIPLPASACPGIPAGAKAYALNVTAMPGGSPMPFLTAYPTGQPQPNASILNAFEGQVVTNSAIVPAGTNGAVDVYAFGKTHVVVEIAGYFGR